MKFSLRSSLALWRRRYAWAQKRLAAARRAHSCARTAKWTARSRQCDAMVRLREHQLANNLNRVSARCVRFIAAQEGGQSRDGLFHAYFDAAGGVWTIGYGHTENVHPGETLTARQASALLWHDLQTRYAPPVFALRLPRQGMIDATVSIVYNCGPGVISTSSTLGMYLHRRSWRQAADAFLLYVHAGGRVLQGLVNRRRAERAMFVS